MPRCVYSVIYFFVPMAKLNLTSKPEVGVGENPQKQGHWGWLTADCHHPLNNLLQEKRGGTQRCDSWP